MHVTSPVATTKYLGDHRCRFGLARWMDGVILLEFILFILFILLLFALLDCSGFYSSAALVVLVVALLVLLGISSYIDGTFITPLCIWELTWLGSLIVARADVDLYLPAKQIWSPGLSQIVYGSTICFYLAYRTVSLIKAIRLERSEWKWDELNINHLLDVLNTGVTIAIFCYVLNILIVGGLPLFSHDLSLRTRFQGTVLFVPFNLVRIASFIYPLALLGRTVDSNRKRVSLMLFVTYSILAAFTGSRGILFQWIISFLTSYCLLKRISWKRQIALVIKICIAIVLLVGLFGYAREYFSNSGNLTASLSEYIPYILYTYITPNFVNLGQAIDSLIPLGFMVYSTEGFWSIILPTSFFAGYEDLSFQIGAFNISTYLLQPYADLGMLGCIIVTMLFGVMSSWAFSRASNGSASLSGLAFLSIMNIIVFSMQNTFVAKSGSIVFWVAIAVYCGRSNLSKRALGTKRTR